MNGIDRPPGILANALWELEKSGKDPPVIIRKRAHSLNGRKGILASGLKEVREALKDLQADREEVSTRIGILGTALEKLKGVPYRSPTVEELIRPKSANGIGYRGMIGHLLETKDEMEYESLGLRGLIDGDIKTRKGKVSPEGEDDTKSLKMAFVPKRKSRENSSSSGEDAKRKPSAEIKEKVPLEPSRKPSTDWKRKSPPEMKTTFSYTPKDEPPIPTKEGRRESRVSIRRGSMRDKRKEDPKGKESADDIEKVFHEDVDLSVADTQTKVLYLAKKEQWHLIDAELDKVVKTDLSLADNVSCLKITCALISIFNSWNVYNSLIYSTCTRLPDLQIQMDFFKISIHLVEN
ncbi:unnamed protein product [Strongylus vulgaris]|uniref:Uncharacterized protein n=1 Tax=Strongylus vulgaris TaxID=40348 RepID=A0A3P7J6B7_STRVU|nr:unnamed protein product [Strongylus vulgaris]